MMALCWLLVVSAHVLAEAQGRGTGMTSSSDVHISWNPAAPAQGDVLQLLVDLPEGMEVGRGTLDKNTLHFDPPKAVPGGKWQALHGIDAEQEPGATELSLWIRPREGGREFVLKRQLPVQARVFGKEELTLPDSKVRLSDESLQRVLREKKEIDALWHQTSPVRMWGGAFLLPVQGGPGSPFGLRRWINGERRSFHTGMDIKAPGGTPVLASNRGRVSMTGDYFFGGRSVFLDHGQGLYTMYFHLSEILVEPGQEVKKGESLGRVGSTGRATGPHLHWGVRLGGARVDPKALIRATQQP
jgi:murein DD-endopeptidase MepM/ murein hydrolase activator NlpD